MINYNLPKIDDCHSRLLDILKDFDHNPLSRNKDMVTEFSFVLADLMRQVATMKYDITRNTINHNKERLLRSKEVASDYYITNGKAISGAQLDRDLDEIFAEDIEKMKREQASYTLESSMIETYKMSLKALENDASEGVSDTIKLSTVPQP